MKKNILTKVLVALVFVLLLASPILLKPDKREGLKQDSKLEARAIKDYGFYLQDITLQAGVDFRHQSPILDKKIKHILPQIASMGASASVCDYDNDGWNDIYFTNSRTGSLNALYHNNQDGSFTDVAGKLGVADLNKKGTGVSMGAVWGDYNNDGYEDLFVYKWGKSELFRNNAGKGFERVTEKCSLPDWANTNTAVWLDVDNDGLLDLFVGAYYKESINLWKLTDTKIMPESYEYANNGGRNYLLKNQGDGTFKDVTFDYGLNSTKWTLAAGAVDMNGDNYPELIIANDYSIDEYYMNEGGKKFKEVSKEVGIGFTPKSGMNISFGDVDNTGQLGIYISNITQMGILLQGNNLWMPEITDGALTYKNVARLKGVELGGWSYGAQFGDLNNDGLLDLYEANGYISGRKGVSYWYDYSKVSGGNKSIISDAANWPAMEGKSQSGYQQNMIWVNRGGVFDDASTKVCAAMTKDSRSVVFADLWNRGVLDVIVANQNNSPLIYKNDVDSTNHWVDFDLQGTGSNRDAIGAKVELYWAGQKQVQALTGGIGFCGQNQHRIHFGIGKSTNVDKAVIVWPSGKEEMIKNPAVDQMHKIVETRGLASLETLEKIN